MWPGGGSATRGVPRQGTVTEPPVCSIHHPLPGSTNGTCGVPPGVVVGEAPSSCPGDRGGLGDTTGGMGTVTVLGTGEHHQPRCYPGVIPVPGAPGMLQSGSRWPRGHGGSRCPGGWQGPAHGALPVPGTDQGHHPGAPGGRDIPVCRCPRGCRVPVLPRMWQSLRGTSRLPLAPGGSFRVPVPREVTKGRDHLGSRCPREITRTTGIIPVPRGMLQTGGFSRFPVPRGLIPVPGAPGAHPGSRYPGG